MAPCNGRLYPVASSTSAHHDASTCGCALQSSVLLIASTSDQVERRYLDRIIRDAKHDARSELSISKGDWSRQGAAADPLLVDPACLEHLEDRYQVPRVHASQLSTAEFVRRYEAPKRPVIVEGLLDEWPATEAWQPAELLRRFSDTRFKVGSDDEGYPVRMKLKHYLSYLLHPGHRDDDSPLYIFDGTFVDAKCAPELNNVRFTFELVRLRCCIHVIAMSPSSAALSLA